MKTQILSQNLNKDNNPFKDSRNREVTKSLFVEYNNKNNDITPLYTLKETDLYWEGELKPSLKQLFLDAEDLTEYEFAKAHFNSYRQWRRISNLPEIKPHVDEWREELELRIKNKLFTSLMESALNEGTKGVTAVKTILEKEWRHANADKKIVRNTGFSKNKKEKSEDEGVLRNLDVFLKSV